MRIIDYFCTFFPFLFVVSCVQPGMCEDARAFTAVLESMQPGLLDFQCEVEGTLIFTERGREGSDDSFGPGGLYDTFSSIFLWRRPGDSCVNTYHRFEPDGEMLREQLVVRAATGEAELYIRGNDAPIGATSIQKSSKVHTDRSGCLGSLYALDIATRLAERSELELTLSEATFEDRPVKLATYSFRELKQPLQRLWIDMHRGGQAVRREVYAAGEALMARADIELAEYRDGDESYWLPVRGRIEGHNLVIDGRPTFPKEPTTIENLYVVNRSMRLNQQPRDETFQRDYKPGTPISDNVRKSQYRFGQQKPPALMTSTEAQVALLEQVAAAEAQRTELVAAPRSSSWFTWLMWVFGAATLASGALVILQRRR